MCFLTLQCRSSFNTKFHLVVSASSQAVSKVETVHEQRSLWQTTGNTEDLYLQHRLTWAACFWCDESLTRCSIDVQCFHPANKSIRCCSTCVFSGNSDRVGVFRRHASFNSVVSNYYYMQFIQYVRLKRLPDLLK